MLRSASWGDVALIHGVGDNWTGGGNYPGLNGACRVTYTATDNVGNIRTFDYFINTDTTAPVITITAPTLQSNSNILNTTITVTDNIAINKNNIIASGTVGFSGLNCTQTSPPK